MAKSTTHDVLKKFLETAPNVELNAQEKEKLEKVVTSALPKTGEPKSDPTREALLRRLRDKGLTIYTMEKGRPLPDDVFNSFKTVPFSSVSNRTCAASDTIIDVQFTSGPDEKDKIVGSARAEIDTGSDVIKLNSF